jgi:hypothetical protein
MTHGSAEEEKREESHENVATASTRNAMEANNHSKVMMPHHCRVSKAKNEP